MAHDGLIIPNAGSVTQHVLAEPDAADFSILGNHRYGVIVGCLVGVTGLNAALQSSTNVAVVNGLVVSTSTNTAAIPSGAASPRFDLVVINATGEFYVISGVAATDPVMPDIPVDVVVLASIYVPAGASSLAAENVVDKRLMLGQSLQAMLSSAQYLIRSLNSASASPDLFDLDRFGGMSWQRYTPASALAQTAASEMTLTGNLEVSGDLAAGDVSADTVTATGEVVAANLTVGAGAPSDTTGLIGALYREQTTGTLYLLRQRGDSSRYWDQLLTADASSPAGTVIQSVSSTAPTGWLPCTGLTYSRTDVGQLWNLMPSWRVDASSMELPDLTGRFLRGGTAGDTGGNSSLVLTQANLPAHRHIGDPATGLVTTNPAPDHVHPNLVNADVGHSHTVAGGGAHGHSVSDPGHRHGGFDWLGNAAQPFVVAYGGRHSMDAIFNDRSHTSRADIGGNMQAATTGVSVNVSGSHQHTADVGGQHAHSITNAPAGGHTHTLVERAVGSGEPIDISPTWYGVYFYIKT